MLGLQHDINMPSYILRLPSNCDSGKRKSTAAQRFGCSSSCLCTNFGQPRMRHKHRPQGVSAMIDHLRECTTLGPKLGGCARMIMRPH